MHTLYPRRATRRAQNAISICWLQHADILYKKPTFSPLPCQDCHFLIPCEAWADCINVETVSLHAGGYAQGSSNRVEPRPLT